MDLLHRLVDAIMASKEQKRARLKELLQEAMALHDTNELSIDGLIHEILEITDGEK